MPTIPAYDPPAFLTDYDAISGQRDGWSRYISHLFDDNIAAIESELGSRNSQFYNETVTSSESPSDSTVTWVGFPRTYKQQLGRQQALRFLEDAHPDQQINGITSRLQDEYLEWRSERNAMGQIVRITFTCEGPEYWQGLAGGPSFYTAQAPEDFGAPGDRALLVQLYRQLVSPDVQAADLFFADQPNRYNPWNKWNTTDGIMHLQQINNTLGAEINICAQGTLLREKGGQPVTDSTRLICCAGYGGVERASDPHLGKAANDLAREGRNITLKNPVGIYMIRRLDQNDFTKPGPNGTRLPAGDYWRPIRPADSDLVVRAVYEVPQGEVDENGRQLTVSDIEIAGEAIQFGGQVAERVMMRFIARHFGPGSFNSPGLACRAKCCRHGSILQVRSLTDSCQDVFPVSQPQGFMAMEAAETFVAEGGISFASLPRAPRGRGLDPEA